MANNRNQYYHGEDEEEDAVSSDDESFVDLYAVVEGRARHKKQGMAPPPRISSSRERGITPPPAKRRDAAPADLRTRSEHRGTNYHDHGLHRPPARELRTRFDAGIGSHTSCDDHLVPLQGPARHKKQEVAPPPRLSSSRERGITPPAKRRDEAPADLRTRSEHRGTYYDQGLQRPPARESRTRFDAGIVRPTGCEDRIVLLPSDSAVMPKPKTPLLVTREEQENKASGNSILRQRREQEGGESNTRQERAVVPSIKIDHVVEKRLTSTMMLQEEYSWEAGRAKKSSSMMMLRQHKEGEGHNDEQRLRSSVRRVRVGSTKEGEEAMMIVTTSRRRNNKIAIISGGVMWDQHHKETKTKIIKGNSRSFEQEQQGHEAVGSQMLKAQQEARTRKQHQHPNRRSSMGGPGPTREQVNPLPTQYTEKRAHSVGSSRVGYYYAGVGVKSSVAARREKEFEDAWTIAGTSMQGSALVLPSTIPPHPHRPPSACESRPQEPPHNELLLISTTFLQHKPQKAATTYYTTPSSQEEEQGQQAGQNAVKLKNPFKSLKLGRRFSWGYDKFQGNMG